MFFFLAGILILVPACFAGTFILCFFILILPGRTKKPGGNPQKRNRILMSLLISLISAIVVPGCLLGLAGVLIAMDESAPKDYWEYSGDSDYFRMPLEPPYELVMIDTLDYATIQGWQNSTERKLSGITNYEKRGNLIFGETSANQFESERIPQDNKWFIFDLSTGELNVFKVEAELIATLNNKGIKDIKLKSVSQNWDEYWKNPKRKTPQKTSPDPNYKH
jgi:hypothetical protein